MSTRTIAAIVAVAAFAVVGTTLVLAEKDKDATGKDTEPPVVLMHQPQDGQTYAEGEPVWINFQTSDNAGLRTAEWFVDGNSVKVWNLKPGGPWITSWGIGGCVPQTCNGLPVGSHTVEVVVTDKGHNETSVAATVEVGS